MCPAPTCTRAVKAAATQKKDETGQVDAEIDCRVVSIRGRVSGQVHGRERVELHLRRVVEPRGNATALASALEQLDPANGQRRSLLALPPHRMSNKPQALARDRDGTLWYATAVGLYRLDATGAAAVRIEPATPLGTLLRDRSGRLWTGGEAGVFLLQDQMLQGRRNLLQVWPKPGADDGAGAIQALVEAPDGHLWFAVGAQGLRRFDPRTGETLALRQDDALRGMLPEDMIKALLIDRAGLLWVGGQIHGVAVADSRGARFPYLADLSGSGPGPQKIDNSVRAIFQDHAGRLWLATDSSRLLRHGPQREFEDFSALSVIDSALSQVNSGRADLGAAGTFNFGALFLYIASAPAFRKRAAFFASGFSMKAATSASRPARGSGADPRSTTVSPGA